MGTTISSPPAARSAAASEWETAAGSDSGPIYVIFSIGDDCLIGMGAAVIKDVDACAVVMGVPGKIVAYQRETGVDLSQRVKLRPDGAAPTGGAE